LAPHCLCIRVCPPMTPPPPPPSLTPPLPHPTQGQFDVAEVPKYYVLLHDNCSAVAVPPANILKDMRSRLSLTNCHMLTINSLHPDTPNLEQADLWSHVSIAPLFPSEGCVCHTGEGEGLPGG
jgi:hypothetical protein